VHRFRRISALLFVASILLTTACGRGQSPAVDGRDVAAAAATTSTTAEPATTSTAEPTTTTEPATASTEPATTAPPTTVAAKAPAPVAAPPRGLVAPTRPSAGTLEPYRGLGTWVDVYDWSHYKGSTPTVGPDQVDQMAAAGVQTLYIQTTKYDAPDLILEPELLLPILERARLRGLAIVAWYLPTLEDPGLDLRRIVASANLDVDGIAIDIESRKVKDVNDRNRRLIELSSAIRELLPGRAIGGIVLPPVLLEVVNPNYWPGFPWREIAPYYDVWQTMGYWTDRTWASGHREAYSYTNENLRRLRNNLGLPDAVIHPVGGIGDETTDGDIDSFFRAAVEHRSIGGSIYDWRTTRPEAWARLRQFRVADRSL